MALDHFISQVHLKNFYAPDLGKRMYAIRKSDLLEYPCNSASQCRIEDGNTNVYLEDERAVEEFLKSIERRYNSAVGALRQGKPDGEAIYTIAGFVAYVMACSPAAMRINSAPVRGSVEMLAAMVERRGDLPEPPPEMGEGTLADMIDDGRIVVDIDPKYPQAVGIASIMDRVAGSETSSGTSWSTTIPTAPTSPATIQSPMSRRRTPASLTGLSLSHLTSRYAYGRTSGPGATAWNFRISAIARYACRGTKSLRSTGNLSGRPSRSFTRH